MADSLRKQRGFRRVGAALPEGMRTHLAVRLRQAGIREDERVWLGKWSLAAFLSGAILMSLYLLIFDPIATPETLALAMSLFLAGGIAIVGVSYFHLYYRISDRASRMEKVLPDFLLLTVSNLRAGMSPFAAFAHAARPEFGPLYGEIMLSTAKSGGKTPLPTSLTEVASYFDSPVLTRTVELFAKGLQSGGQLAKLLTSIAQEVRRIQDLRAELTSATRTYTLFLGFILVIVMPFLLAVSSHFVAVFLAINLEGATTDLSAAGSIPVFSGTILITTGDMVVISLAAIISTAFFISMLIGIVARGRAVYGIKYFPLMAVGSSIGYFIAKSFIETFLSGFAG
ncbi:MAG: type II secretion system F family protein [Candidatus Micrarchaeota archaeon]